MKRWALLLFSIAFLSRDVLFSETVYPKPLKVRQICGQVVVANRHLELRKEPQGTAIADAISSSDGSFAFWKIQAGNYWLAIPGLTTQDVYPLTLIRPVKTTVCGRRLFVNITKGMDSSLMVSFSELGRQ